MFPHNMHNSTYPITWHQISHNIYRDPWTLALGAILVFSYLRTSAICFSRWQLGIPDLDQPGKPRTTQRCSRSQSLPSSWNLAPGPPTGCGSAIVRQAVTAAASGSSQRRMEPWKVIQWRNFEWNLDIKSKKLGEISDMFSVDGFSIWHKP